MAKKIKISMKSQNEQMKLFEISSFVANPDARDEDLRNFALALENLSENTFIEIIKQTEKNLLTDPDEENISDEEVATSEDIQNIMDAYNFSD